MYGPREWGMYLMLRVNNKTTDCLFEWSVLLSFSSFHSIYKYIKYDPIIPQSSN